MECLFIGWRGRGTAWLSRREGHTGGRSSLRYQPGLQLGWKFFQAHHLSTIPTSPACRNIYCVEAPGSPRG